MNYLDMHVLWKKWGKFTSHLLRFLWICWETSSTDPRKGEGVWEALLSQKTWTYPRPWISRVWFENPFINLILGAPGVVCWIFFSAVFFFEGCIGGDWDACSHRIGRVLKVYFLEKHVSMRAPSDARGSVHWNRWIWICLAENILRKLIR